MKIKRIVLGESASAALHKAADGALTKESVDSLVTTVESLMNKKIKSIASALLLRMKKENAARISKWKKQYAAENNKKLAKYVNYVVKEWMKKNRPGIRQAIEARQNSEIVAKMKAALSEMRVPVGSGNASKIVTKLSESVDTLTKKLDDANKKIVAKENVALQLKRLVVIERLGRDLTKLQVEKLTNLSKSIKAKTIEDFAAKAKKVKESIVASPKPKPKAPVVGESTILSRAASIV